MHAVNKSLKISTDAFSICHVLLFVRQIDTLRKVWSLDKKNVHLRTLIHTVDKDYIKSFDMGQRESEYLLQKKRIQSLFEIEFFSILVFI